MHVMLFLLGVISMITQVSFLREIIAVFRGGELTIGAALFFWLFWTSLGSLVPLRSDTMINDPDRIFQRLFPWYALAGFAGYCAVGALPTFITDTPGVLISYDMQIIVTAIAYAPFNIIGGMLFALGARALAYKKANAAGTAYILEASGAALAGITASLLLVPAASNTVLACIPPIAGIAVPALINWRHTKPGTIIAAVIVTGCLFGGLMLLGAAEEQRYSGQTVLKQTDTRFGRLTVTSHAEQTTIYSGPSMLISQPDRATDEYAAHLPLLAHSQPRHVLVLGGSPGGITGEILKHPSVESITCVELDPALFDMSGRYLDDHWRNDPRIDIRIADARSFLAETPDRFDVIIMRMPPPLTGSANRYHTAECFHRAAAVLSGGGVLSFALTGEKNYLGDNLSDYLASVGATLREAFPTVTMLPGSVTRVIAMRADSKAPALSWQQLEERRIARGIDTRHVRDYYLSDLFSPFRKAMMEEALESVDTPAINRDFLPSGLWKRTVVQGEIEQSRLIGALDRHVGGRCLIYTAVIAGLLLITVMIPGGSTGKQRRALAAIVSVGMTEISLEIIAILAYQSVFGLLYGRIALLTGAYMAGLAIGGYAGIKRGRKTGSVAYLAFVQAGIALVAAGWLAVIVAGEYHSLRSPSVEALFFLLTALSGVTGGMQFPEANALFRLSSRHVDHPGAVYGADLLGSSFGALVTGSLMVPLLGMRVTLTFLIILNLAVASVFFTVWNRN